MGWRKAARRSRVLKDWATEEEKLAALSKRMGLKAASPSAPAQAFLEQYERQTSLTRELYDAILAREKAAR